MKEPLQRSDFGNGKLGEISFQWIMSGTARCEARLENGHPCGKIAIGTTDFDTFGDTTTSGHCSPEHHEVIIFQIRSDSQSRAQQSVFGKNGWGRA